MIAYAGLEVEEKNYALDASGQEAWDKDKFNLGLDFPNVNGLFIGKVYYKIII
jgi:hypothetical protein